MFYPVKSLRRGGKFHMYWIADCYPNRLNTKLGRILWEKDIRMLCEDLREVIMNESGSASNRFSLRLSSQLMRGLVRLYDKKLSLFLERLCMFSALIWQHTNMITETEDVYGRRQRVTNVRRPRTKRVSPQAQAELLETIQNNNNTVARVDDITLREDNLLPREIPVDGFGEEQGLNILNIEQIELMRAPETSIQHHSGLDLNVLDVTDRSRDHTRIMLQPQMENIHEVDNSMFNKSAGVGEMLPSALEKEVPPIPDILPDLPVPNNNVDAIREEVIPAERQLERSTDFDLEPLEDVDIRRRKKKERLIIDEYTRLSTVYMKKRVEDLHIEQRCQKHFEDFFRNDKVPVNILFRRSAVVNSGLSFRRAANCGEPAALELRHLFGRVRSLPKPTVTGFNNELETMLRQKWQHPLLQPIKENEILQDVVQPMQIDHQVEDVHRKDVSDAGLVLGKVQAQMAQIVVPPEIAEFNKQVEMSLLPTQILEELQINREDVRNDITEPCAKKMCIRGSKEKRSSDSVRRSHRSKENEEVQQERSRHIASESLPLQKQMEIEYVLEKTKDDSRRNKSADKRKRSDDSDEPQLGSLDRTKMSLDSHHEESEVKKFLNKNWNMKETFIKIAKIRSELPEIRLDVNKLLKEYRMSDSCQTPTRFIAAKCFTSLLILSQHGFITLEKDPKTLEIINIEIRK